MIPFYTTQTTRNHGGDIYDKKESASSFLDFSANINPFGLPKNVIEAAQDAVLQATVYPDPEVRELKKALSEFHDVPSFHIICGNGACELIFRLAQALRAKTVLITAPAFSEYEQAFVTANSKISYIPLVKENQFRLTDAIFPLLAEKPDALILCNPNNPTGHTIEPELLTEILKVCRKQNTFFLLDECFIDFLDDPEAHTQLARISTDMNIMILKAFTKLYAMPGLRLGYALSSNRDLFHRMDEMAQPWTVSKVAQAAGIAALKETAYREKSRKFIISERNKFKEALAQLGLTIIGGEANYIFFHANCPNLKERLLPYKILIRSCANYNGLDDFYYRVSVRLPHENEFLFRAIRKVL